MREVLFELESVEKGKKVAKLEAAKEGGRPLTERDAK